MAFIDLNTKHPSSFSIPVADVVLIGAGAAGILLAIKLCREGKNVLVLESGQFNEDNKKQALNNVQQAGKILENAVWGRKRAVGGTTIAWGGQSLPFTSIDFEKRDWVQNSGWPLSYDDMKEHYEEANAFMGIDNMNYTTDIVPHILPHHPLTDSSIFDLHVSKWATQPNFYLLYKDELDKKVTVLYNAHVTNIQKKEKFIESITISNFNHTIFKLNIKTLIMTAGTIETIRMLLNNNIGNHSGWLGKNFMDHPCIEGGTIKVRSEYSFQRYFNTHFFKGRKYSIRISLNKKFQEQKKLLNCSASLMFSLPQDAFNPYGELKSFRKDLKLYRLIKLSGSIVNILKSAKAYIFNHFYYKANAVTTLALMIEQEPTNRSYISLSNIKDKFGISQALINWHITYKTWETAVTTAEAIKKEIELADFGKVNLYNHINLNNLQWYNYLSDVCHHMGGCKMSALPQDGVVNKNLQVWGINNLYICSCAIFPTSSHSNPTLTMLALASRLAHHLN